MKPIDRAPLNRKSGFTLVELIVVVAIVAILASIAAPIIDRAVTQSRVARVRSEINAVATALEAYHVDNNAYPPSEETAAEYPDSSFNRIGAGYFAYMGRLTTPVAYLGAELPIDPWNTLKKSNSGFGWTFFEYWSTSHVDFRDFTATREIAPRIHYCVMSWGPDEIFDALGWDSLYDPTNGVRSRGDIVVFGPK